MNVTTSILGKDFIIALGNMELNLVTTYHGIVVIDPTLFVKSEFVTVKSNRFSNVEGKEYGYGTLQMFHDKVFSKITVSIGATPP